MGSKMLKIYYREYFRGIAWFNPKKFGYISKDNIASLSLCKETPHMNSYEIEYDLGKNFFFIDMFIPFVLGSPLSSDPNKRETMVFMSKDLDAYYEQLERETIK